VASPNIISILAVLVHGTGELVHAPYASSGVNGSRVLGPLSALIFVHLFLGTTGIILVIAM
jgi:hypothetical protein